MSSPESTYLPPAAAAQDPARDRIVAVATRLFYRRGIRAVGVDTVIAESGVAKTTLYKHFRSKDALIAECLHRLDDRYFRGCAFINASVELADPDHPARAAIANHKTRSRELIERLAREAGLDDPRTVSDHLMLLMEGAIITALVEQDWAAARRAGAAAGKLLR